ncbi:streptomycin biosynthesis protein [Actinomadura rudentiformis]|uniref:Streptomycin biosynthesis protein n=1 Tax=Actinomadura rudentiformis TaxID=359158 RepID=A0A6H9YZD8_9ACTN|nr:streptomycin biosynthesis protein [Actinomadura rudentiformis]
MEEVQISSLSTGGSPRLAGEDLAHVQTLVASQAQLPPIIVHRPTMRVVDGMHRLLAAKLQGHQKIAVRFFDGPEEDAFVLAVKSNIAHGLPLSLADRKHAAERVIVSHPQWSDRMIASVTGISARTVAEIRKTAAPASTSGRIGLDGRIRSTDVTEGRRLAQELITKDPALSLRQVAQAAGISPETVRDVKKRLSRGEDPLPRRSKQLGTQLTQRPRSPAPPSAAVLERLRADPALRFNENGRDLLRLLNAHTLRAEDWNKLAESVPPHSVESVARLARDTARKWLEFASLIERNNLKR